MTSLMDFQLEIRPRHQDSSREKGKIVIFPETTWGGVRIQLMLDGLIEREFSVAIKDLEFVLAMLKTHSVNRCLEYVLEERWRR